MSFAARLAHYAWRLTYAVLALGVALYAARLLYSAPDMTNRFDAAFATLRSLAVPGHFFFGGLALALTPLQLSGHVRRRWPRVHRFGGLLYGAAILVAGLSALRLAPAAQYGWVPRVGFITLAVLWLGTTAFAVQRALARDYAAHGRWMARSVALTSSAITLRIMLGLGVGVAGLPMAVVYPTTAWTCWLINLGVCELLLAGTSGRHLGSSLRTA